jgi:hypothetical protein
MPLGGILLQFAGRFVMPNLGTLELLLILVVVILPFGTGRISQLGGEIGQGLKGDGEE